MARSADEGPAALGRLALSYHYLRDALSTGIALPQGVRSYLDGVNVVSLAIAPDTSTQVPSARVSLDVWHRELGILSLLDGRAPPGHPQVLAGVLGHVAERAALDDGNGAADPRFPPHIGVGTVFEAATRDAVPITALRGELPESLSYGPRVDVLVGEALQAGDVIIIPERPVALGGEERVGWWRVDPRSGVTVDQMDDGRGEEGTEYQIPLTRSFKTASCLLALSGTIFDALDKVLEKLELTGWKEAVGWAKIGFQEAAAYFAWTGKCR